MKKLMMMTVAIVAAVMANANTIREDLKAIEDQVCVVSNNIVATQKTLAELVANTNMTAETKAVAVVSVQNRIKNLEKDLDVAKETAKLAKNEIDVLDNNKVKMPVGIKDLSLADISNESAAKVASGRYNKGKKLYHNEWFSSADDALNNVILRGIENTKDINEKAELLFEYMSEQL